MNKMVRNEQDDDIDAVALVREAFDPNKAETYIGSARAYLERGYMATAICVLLDGIERCGKSSEMLRALENAYFQAGCIEEAADTFSESINLEEESILEIPLSWREELERYQEAEYLVLNGFWNA